MISMPFELSYEDNNPLDLIEELVNSKGWKVSESDGEFMVIEAKGDKTTYQMCVEWQEEFSALLFSCAMPVEITDATYETAIRTIEKANQNIWLGHFDLSHKNRPTFRHTMMLRMIPAGIAVDIAQDLFNLAISECDRFYTTFQLIQAGDIAAVDNLKAVVFETVGEA